LNANITQNLLRGAGCDVNLVRVWTAKNDFVSSLYQLQQVLINLVTDVQNAYWDVFLALRTLQIQRTAYDVARQLRLRAEEFVRVGRAAPLEALSAQAEEASRISAVINAASDLKRQELAFLRLINPECLESGWRSLVYPAEAPILPTERLVPEEHVRLARYYRPDLRQAQIDLANGELEVVRTENGLLPQLDLVADYSLAGSGNRYGNSLEKIGDRDFPTYRVGLQFSYSLQNRAANAAYRRATFQRRLAEEAIRNFCQIIDVDVRTAIIEIERTRRLIDSTRVTEALRIRELEAESEKFRVGRSTQINVNQAQRDLVQAQLDRVTAEVANIKAYLGLYRAEGTALLRRGIEPIKITPESGVP
jgi:outer membrane protein TolC